MKNKKPLFSLNEEKFERITIKFNSIYYRINCLIILNIKCFPRKQKLNLCLHTFF